MSEAIKVYSYNGCIWKISCHDDVITLEKFGKPEDDFPYSVVGFQFSSILNKTWKATPRGDLPDNQRELVKLIIEIIEEGELITVY